MMLEQPTHSSSDHSVSAPGGPSLAAPATPEIIVAPETGESEGNAAIEALGTSAAKIGTADVGAASTESATDAAGVDKSAAPQEDRPRASSAPAKAGGHTSPTALQDLFLNGLRRENIDAVIYFCDGSQERGAVRAFDTFTILLENRSSGKLQLVYKHAIARIFPTRCPQLTLPGRPRGKS
jgi:host factor-I protein